MKQVCISLAAWLLLPIASALTSTWTSALTPSRTPFVSRRRPHHRSQMSSLLSSSASTATGRSFQDPSSIGNGDERGQDNIIGYRGNGRQQLQSVEKRPLSQAEYQKRISYPFPNGPCGGTLVSIPPEDTFSIDINLSKINLGGDLVLPPRTIKVWLPPGYDANDPSVRHPVLYAHDGQNAIDDMESWTGASWRLAGALTRLYDHGRLAIPHLPILVLLPSADGDLLPAVRRRHLEYGDVLLPFSTAHADLVARTIKPLVDARFHTNPDRDATFAIGASLGGQAALHLKLRHPGTFGGAACMSPFFGPSIIQQARRYPDRLRNKRLYIDIGGDLDNVNVPWLDLFDHITPQHWWNPGYWWLDTQLQASVDSMREALDLGGVRYGYCQIPGGRHNERAWAQRIDRPLMRLFGEA